jgi:peptidoglycan/xylan/chitin deacetylase (PgdA/CDA1 family)
MSNGNGFKSIMPDETINNVKPIGGTNSSICNCVVFRMDDIQDYWLNTVQTAVMDTFVTQNKTLSLGLIMNATGSDPQILEKINQGLEKQLFELDIHGWEHVNYSALNEREQYDLLLKSKEKIQDLFGVTTTVFIPPLSVFNNGTLKAMERLGINILSSDIPEESKFNLKKSIFNITNVSMGIAKKHHSEGFEREKGAFHIPATIFFMDYQNGGWIKIPVKEILNNVTNNIKDYGYAVIVLHPQDFALYTNTTKVPRVIPANSVDHNEISDLSEILYNLQSNNIRVVTFEDIIAHK